MKKKTDNTSLHNTMVNHRSEQHNPMKAIIIHCTYKERHF